MMILGSAVAWAGRVSRQLLACAHCGNFESGDTERMQAGLVIENRPRSSPTSFVSSAFRWPKSVISGALAFGADSASAFPDCYHVARRTVSVQPFVQHPEQSRAGSPAFSLSGATGMTDTKKPNMISQDAERPFSPVDISAAWENYSGASCPPFQIGCPDSVPSALNSSSTEIRTQAASGPVKDRTHVRLPQERQRCNS